ncbi:MAG: hypothetical protein HY265_02215 [Deltaproteobacteria bacterium]|nr:hypothetical protein [Deltaproteobacteria bacterium]
MVYILIFIVITVFPCSFVFADGITLTLSGPDAPQNGSKYTASGGEAPYSWTISKGSINSSTGVVTVSGQCGTATITATDSCGNTGSKDVRMANGRWVLVDTWKYPQRCYNSIWGAIMMLH